MSDPPKSRETPPSGLGLSERPPERPILPLPNYTLSSVCPACTHPTVRLACKVRCERCGFVWDCSEL